MSSGATSTYFFPYPLQTDPVDVASDVQDLAEAIDAQFVLTAPLLSPQFTGIPLSVTPNNSDNSTKIATTAFVKNQGYLTSSTASSTYAPLASPTFTGTVTTPLTTAGVVTTTSGGVLGSVAILPIASGGTNTSSTPTAGAVVYGTGTAQDYTSAGIAGQFLQSSGSGAPVWANVVGSLYQSSAPITPQTGTIWTDSDTDVLYVYNGSTWHSPMGLEMSSPTFSSNAYTLVASDRSKFLQLDNGGTACTVFIPTNASVPFPIGTQIQVLQSGTGLATIVATTPGTTTVNATPGSKLRAQWSSATIVKRATDTWVVIGDLAI